MLTPSHLIFYAFAFVAVFSAVLVITARNPVRSVLSLVVTFFSMAGIWMMLEAEFLSLILILVYVGAVMTLFLFVVMMLNIDRESKQSGFVRYWPIGLVVTLALTGLVMLVLSPNYFGAIDMPLPAVDLSNASNTEQLGMLLYTQYAYPFEVAGVILLAGIIAAITLTHRGPRARKVQSVSKQVAANPKTGLRIIKMASEPKQGN